MKRQKFLLFFLVVTLFLGCSSKEGADSGLAPSPLDPASPQGSAIISEMVGKALTKAIASSALEISGFPVVGLEVNGAGGAKTITKSFCQAGMSTLLNWIKGGQLHIQGDCNFKIGEGCEGFIDGATFTFVAFLIDGLLLDGQTEGDVTFFAPECSEDASSLTLSSLGPIKVTFMGMEVPVVINSLRAIVRFTTDPITGESKAVVELLRIEATVGEGDNLFLCSGATLFTTGESTLSCHRPGEDIEPPPGGLFLCKPACEIAPCGSLLDCAFGMECEDGCCVEAPPCLEPCSVGLDCSDGKRCTDGCCVEGEPPPDCPESACDPSGACPRGEECVQGCCIPLAVCPPEQIACSDSNSCPIDNKCIDGCCVPQGVPVPAPEPSAMKLQEQPPPTCSPLSTEADCGKGCQCRNGFCDCSEPARPTGPPCSVAEDCEGTGCVCFNGSCECLIPPAGCGDCILQDGETCETGENCHECRPDRYIPEAQCGDKEKCDKTTCTCSPIEGETNFCLGEDDDCDMRGSCENRFGLGPSFCYTSSLGCSDSPGLGEGSGVYCADNPFVAGSGEGICEALEDGLATLGISSEMDCNNHGAFACCINFFGNYCPGQDGNLCSSLGGICEERLGLGNKFCWTEDTNICPAIPTVVPDGVPCLEGENGESICEALKSTSGTSLEIDCVQQSNGNYCCVSPDVPPPLPESDCTDEVDNDGDGKTDCEDGDCSSNDACKESICDDGLDNDGDEGIDCKDPDCFFDPACRETKCDDDLDNDGDENIDCKDTDCEFDPACREALCEDGLDNDGDGKIDCQDPDCGCPELICDDREDNDGDELIDCADFDCWYTPPCQEQGAECGDGTDNDGDGLVDCNDFEYCGSQPNCRDTPCDDGLDSDNDFLADCDDPDCEFDPACREEGLECDDDVDNDGDGDIDCADTNCAFESVCQPAPTSETICNDEKDDDNDLLVDCFDKDDCCKSRACTFPTLHPACL